MQIWSKFKLKRKYNLYCCGNCKYRVVIDYDNHTKETCKKGKVAKSYEYCSSYEFDGIDRALRLIN